VLGGSYGLIVQKIYLNTSIVNLFRLATLQVS